MMTQFIKMVSWRRQMSIRRRMQKKEAENAVKEQKRQVESKQTAADAAKQALETAKQEFDNMGGAQALQDARTKKRLLEKCRAG